MGTGPVSVSAQEAVSSQGGRCNLIEMKAGCSTFDREEDTEHLTDEERESYKLHIRNGHFFSSREHIVWNSLWQTLGYAPPAEEPVSRWLKQNFVISQDESLFAFPAKLYKHTAPTRGAPVVFAGEAYFSYGRLVRITNDSGHYKPTLVQLYRALVYLRQRGVDLSETEVYYTQDRSLGSHRYMGLADEFVKAIEAQLAAGTLVEIQTLTSGLMCNEAFR